MVLVGILTETETLIRPATGQCTYTTCPMQATEREREREGRVLIIWSGYFPNTESSPLCLQAL